MIQPPESAYYYTVRPECETNYFVHGNNPNYSPLNVTVYQNPIPGWIQPVAYPKPADLRDDNKRNNPQLLCDSQIDVATRTFFEHMVLKIWNVFDLENFSNLSIEFDPAFQALTLHECKIFRNGEWINKLDMNELRIVQKEEDLDDNIYSANLTALLFLEDIREGDILDYSYSTTGWPLPRFSFRYYLQSGFRWEQKRLRVVKEPNRFIQKNISPSDWNSHLSENDNEIIWEMTPCPSYKREPHQPPGYQWIANFEMSEFANWNDVATLLASYYQLSDDFKNDAEALQLVKLWKENGATLEEQALQAIQYVQDKIRYTGIEEGTTGGFQPTDCLATLKRRFGDCKDKSQLLRAFLDLLGIHSDICLVSTTDCDSVKNQLPNMFTFNHAILRIELDDIVTYVDATATYVGGNLTQMSCPFGSGLIISEKTENLVTIPKPIVHPEVECQTTFEIKPGDVVQMSAIINIFGEEANYYRNTLKRLGLNRVIEPFQNYIEAIFHDFKPLSPAQIKDDRLHNHLTLSVSLQLENPWNFKRKKSTKCISFAPYFLAKYFSQKVDTDRETPLQLTSSGIKESVLVKGGYLLASSETIENDYFTFHSTLTGSDRIDYELTTNLDQLPPDDLASFEEALDEGFKDISVQIKRR